MVTLMNSIGLIIVATNWLNAAKKKIESTAMEKTRVLFVCLGNICRSPLAEGIFSKKVEEAGLSHRFVIDSCGTSAFHIGEQPDPRTRANARDNGVLLDHQARQFLADDFDRFDYILPMDASNLRNVRSLEPATYQAKVTMMRDYDREGRGMDVPDPYYGGSRGFQNVFDILERSTEELLETIQAERGL